MAVENAANPAAPKIQKNRKNSKKSKKILSPHKIIDGGRKCGKSGGAKNEKK